MKDLIRFRSYIWGSVRREFSLRFRGSMFGAALVFVAPAIQIAIYALVFGSLLKGRLPGHAGPYAYPVYLCAGLLLWNLFAEIVQRSQNVYLDNANLIKKNQLPLKRIGGGERYFMQPHLGFVYGALGCFSVDLFSVARRMGLAHGAGGAVRGVACSCIGALLVDAASFLSRLHSVNTAGAAELVLVFPYCLSGGCSARFLAAVGCPQPCVCATEHGPSLAAWYGLASSQCLAVYSRGHTPASPHWANDAPPTACRYVGSTLT